MSIITILPPGDLEYDPAVQLTFAIAVLRTSHQHLDNRPAFATHDRDIITLASDLLRRLREELTTYKPNIFFDF